MSILIQDTFSVSPQFSNTLYPEISPGYSNGNIPQKNYYTKDTSIYGENTDEALDAISNILTATSLVPGIDTFADAAAIPVDLLRGDYISAGLDAFGILPFVGEVADTAKLARAGMNVADVAHDAGKVIDAVKTIDAAADVADAVKTADDGYEYITRWHTRNPTAPLDQRDVWIVERKIKGIGAEPNHRQGLHQVCVGNNKWITLEEWKKAAVANQLGFATELQKEWLKNGHWKA